MAKNERLEMVRNRPARTDRVETVDDTAGPIIASCVSKTPNSVGPSALTGGTVQAHTSRHNNRMVGASRHG